MMSTTETIEQYTHWGNLCFFVTSFFCFLCYLLYKGFFIFLAQSEFVLFLSIAQAIISVYFLGFQGSYIAFFNCLIWVMIVHGLKGKIPSMEMYKRNKYSAQGENDEKKSR